MQQGTAVSCSYVITVIDTIAPAFVNCPTDTLIIGTDVDNCTAFVNFSTPIAEDNCEVTVSQITGPGSGSTLDPGFYTVQFLAEDAANNTDTCTFVIHVNDTQIPTIACPSNDVVVEPDAEACTWTSPMNSISPTTTLGNCPFEITYEITGATMATGMDDASGTVFNLGTSQVCYTITETMDADSNGILTSTCCFNVIVEDNEGPELSCPADVVLNTDTGDCSAEYTFTHPSPTDNCGIGMLEIAYLFPDGSTEGPTAVMGGEMETRTFDLGVTTITYIATDDNGNISSCDWTITVEDNDPPMLTCISDTIVYADADCQFTQMTNGFDPVTEDNCPLTAGTLLHDYIFAPNQSTLAGASFPVGITLVNWTLMDEQGNQVMCSYAVTVLDTIPPSFVNCPTDTLMIGTDVDNCTAFVNFSTPIASDNCEVIVSQITGPGSGSTLEPGFYTVQFLAEDASNNTDTCEFVIHVNDTQKPTVACPSNDIVVSADAGVCTWTSPAGSIAPTVTMGNCPFVITYEITGATAAMGMNDASGEIFNLGTSQVCYTITETMDTDSNGIQSTTCCFTIIVEDTEAPVVICPADEILSTDEGLCEASFTWTHPDTSDNCGTADLAVAYLNPDASFEGLTAVVPGASVTRTFDLGVTTITYVITDQAGNTSSCEWTVTVEDTEDPVIECIGDSTLFADADCVFTQTTGGFDPVISDNCPGSTLLHDYLFAPDNSTLLGASFAIGSTNVNWTLTDAAGNTSSCSYVITVVDTIPPAFINCPTDTLINRN